MCAQTSFQAENISEEFGKVRESIELFKKQLATAE